MLQYGNENELAEFEQAVQEVKNLKYRPEDDELLKLYGLYKQALEGNNKTPVPGMLSFKEKAKWNAWKSEVGKGRSRARREYISHVQTLKSKYN